MALLKDHSNIVSYEDHCIIEHADGIGWDILIKMELLTPMIEWMLENPVDEVTVLRLGKEISSALGFAAAHGLIHRDVKPGNIFVDSIGDFKLGDFGIARVMDKTTGCLSKKGTESYMPPEVYQGRANDRYIQQIDIYSLGMVLYCLMNQNRLPFYPLAPLPITYKDVENALMRRMRGDSLPKPCMGSEDIKRVILKACAYDPKDRFSSMAEMYDALKSVNIFTPVTKDNRNITTVPQNLEKEETIKKSFNKKLAGIVSITTAIAISLAVGIIVIRPKLETNSNKISSETETMTLKETSKSTSELKKTVKDTTESKETSKDTTTSKEKSENYPSYYYATKKTNVYSKSDENSECLDELENGQEISYYENESTDDWLCIKYKNGHKAYVRKADVSSEIPNGRVRFEISTGWGNGYYMTGQKIRIEAEDSLETSTDNFRFCKWSSSIMGTVKAIYSKTTEVTIPEKDLVITEILRGEDWNPIQIQTERLEELLTDYTVKINGDAYSLPMLCEEFEQKGWTSERNGYKHFGKNETEMSVPFQNQNNSSEIQCDLKWGTDSGLYIVGFSIYKEPDTDLQIEFPGGIIFGKATRNDVKNAYGETNHDLFSGDDFRYMGYWREYGVGVSFGFSDSGQMETFVLDNEYW